MRTLALIAALPLAACSFGSHGHDDDGSGAPASGTGTSRSYAVADFTSVDLRGSDDADIRVGAAFSIRAEGPVNMLDELKIEKVGDTLKIGRKSGSHFHWGSDGGRSVKIFVTMPKIAAASIAGSGNITVDRVEGGSFSGSTSGSGDLGITQMNVDAAELSIAGSGDIEAAGNAKQLTMAIQGSGNIDASHLTASAAHVSIAGSGDASATVNGHAEVSMMGSGDVDLGDGATCTVNKMGSGEVHCGH